MEMSCWALICYLAVVWLSYLSIWIDSKLVCMVSFVVFTDNIRLARSTINMAYIWSFKIHWDSSEILDLNKDLLFHVNPYMTLENVHTKQVERLKLSGNIFSSSFFAKIWVVWNMRENIRLQKNLNGQITLVRCFLFIGAIPSEGLFSNHLLWSKLHSWQ